MTLARRIVGRLKANPYRKIIKKFADKAGLVYFGYIDPLSEEYKPVKGFTVSMSHTDNHHSIGTIGGYNTNIVYRNDVDRHGNVRIVSNWFILTIDLHTSYPVPHFMITANNQDMRAFNHLFTSFPNMHPLDVSSGNKIVDDEFNTRFKIHARPAKSIDIEGLLTIDAMRYLSAHLWPLSVEQHNNTLYVYALNENIKPKALDKMLENGLWLADHLDKMHDSKTD